MGVKESKLVEAVRRKRTFENLSIRSLSEIVGVSFSSLARIERGEGEPDNNTRVRLIEWLGADADGLGIVFDKVAYVHFRAAKNVRSSTVHHLLLAAECLARKHRIWSHDDADRPISEVDILEEQLVVRSKEELEEQAGQFRKELGLGDEDALDSLKLQADGVIVTKASAANCIEDPHISFLLGPACAEWSAMSVPIDRKKEQWTILLNDKHSVQRQRVTLLEEVWHILLGHKLTKVAKIGDVFGRTYDKTEEHDAYYLASASLLPKVALCNAVARRCSSYDIAAKFGTSTDLVDYRLKRLGLWREHTGKKVSLGEESS